MYRRCEPVFLVLRADFTYLLVIVIPDSVLAKSRILSRNFDPKMATRVPFDALPQWKFVRRTGRAGPLGWLQVDLQVSWFRCSVLDDVVDSRIAREIGIACASSS